VNSELKDWELETINALAREALNQNINKGREVRNEERWLEVAITERQNDARTSAKYRSQIQRHAERLGIGNQHPTKSWEPEEYEVATPETAARWMRMIKLTLTLEKSHPWRQLHWELCAMPVLEHRHDPEAEKWRWPNGGFDTLLELETCALDHGLISAEESLDLSDDPAFFFQRIARALAGKQPPKREHVPIVAPDPEPVVELTLAERLLAMAGNA
jgi:hypothetical protein